MVKFTIPVAPVTKKNHQRIIRNGRTGRPMVIQSDAYRRFEKEALLYCPKMEPITRKVNVSAKFYMKTRRRVDLVNLLEALCDVLKLAGIVEDDNSNIIAHHDGCGVYYDKENPRIVVEIYEVEE